MYTTRIRSSLVIVFLVFAQLVPMATTTEVAGASTAKLPSIAISTNTISSTNNIRLYFFCSTASCKKDKALNATAAHRGILQITDNLRVMVDDTIPTSEALIIDKYRVDGVSLVNAYNTNPVSTNSYAVGEKTNVIYYQTANLQSDAYLLNRSVKGLKPLFKSWSAGVVAIMQVIYLDTQMESGHTTTAQSMSVNRDLQLVTESLKRDENGPDKVFNKLINKFVTTQLLDCNLTTLELENKSTGASAPLIAGLPAQLSAEYSSISATLKKLLAKGGVFKG